jgi:2-polyprenyl-6-methoxyphenol hydroxylase-like FAD-dependent oxidoreductase
LEKLKSGRSRWWEVSVTMGERLTTSVVIVGYGPTGQVLALLLARKGHNVVVVERWPDLYPLPRAVHFDHEAARILQAAGVIREISDITEDISTYEWRNAERELLLELDWTGKGISGWPISTMFAQPELERVLDRMVKAQPRIKVLQGWEAAAITQDSDGVMVAAARGEVRDGLWAATGERSDIRARYVVGADGANSFVRTALDIQTNDLGFVFDWLVVDVVPQVAREWIPKTWQLCDPKRPTTVVPGGPGRRRWEFMLLPGEQAADMNKAEVAWALLAPWDMTAENAKLERHAVYTFRGRWAEQWRKGRAFLAGDAAHLMPPFAGQGMCAGLRDACALAWRLDMALTGALPETVFDSYTSERCGHVQAMIEFSIELGKVICITDAEQAAQRDRDMLAARAAPGYQAPPPLLPRLGPGLYAEDNPGSGFLSPQGIVATGDKVGLFDDLFGVRFALITRHGRDLEGLTGQNAAFLKSLGAVVVALDADSFRDVEGVYQSWLDSLNSAAILVRPDFYVYGSARTSDGINALIERLRSGLRLPSEQSSSARGRARVEA